MTGGITHYNRPVCIFPQEPDQPCHGALMAITADYTAPDALLACDRHAVAFIDKVEDLIIRIDIIDETGKTRPWWVENDESKGPDVERARRYAMRAFTDHGCCFVHHPDGTIEDPQLGVRA